MSKPNTPNEVTSPTTDGKDNTRASSSRVFVRHEFHRAHRATEGNNNATLVRAKGETAAADAKKEKLIRELAEEDKMAQQKKANAKAAAKQADVVKKDVSFGAERVPLMYDASSPTNGTSSIDADTRVSYGGSDAPLVMDRASVYHDDGSEPKPQKANTSRLSLRGSVRSVKEAVFPSSGKGGIGRLSQRFSGYGTEELRVERKKSLGVLTLCGLMFANSIGGGYGLEDSVSAGGGLLTILFVVVLPLIWSLPMALVVAELATSISTNGGFLMWINVAFPAPVFFFTVFMTTMLVFVDNALYPNLFAEYLCRSFECEDWHEKIIKVCILLICSFLNLIGVEAVGVASVIVMLMSVAPFVMMFFWHMIESEAYFNWEAVAYIPSNINWVAIIPVVSWNVAGLEQAGAVAEDIDNPQDTMVKSLIPLAFMTWMSYIPPILAGLSLTRGAANLEVWETGYWATVAQTIGGPFLKIFTVIGGIASAFGMCMSGLCTTSRTLAGMGEAAAFPRPISNVLFTYNKRFGTPHWSIVINTIFTGVFATFFDFSYLVVIDEVLYGIRILFIFLACIKLRYAYPTLERPYRVPVSSDKLALLLILPILYCITLIVVSASVDATTAGIIVGVGVGVMIFSYFYCRFFRPHGFDGKIIRVEEIVHSESCTEDEDNEDADNDKTVDDSGAIISPTDPDAPPTEIVGSTSNHKHLTKHHADRNSKRDQDDEGNALPVHHYRRSRRKVITKSVIIEDVEGVAYGETPPSGNYAPSSSRGVEDVSDDEKDTSGYSYDNGTKYNTNGADSPSKNNNSRPVSSYNPPTDTTGHHSNVSKGDAFNDNAAPVLPSQDDHNTPSNKNREFSDAET